jgi:hypothetical protein
MSKLEPFQIQFLRGIERDGGSCVYSMHLLPGVGVCTNCPINNDPRKDGIGCTKDKAYKIAVELLMEYEIGL